MKRCIFHVFNTISDSDFEYQLVFVQILLITDGTVLFSLVLLFLSSCRDAGCKLLLESIYVYMM